MGQEPELNESEEAAALAVAIWRFAADDPTRLPGIARGLAANYAYQRDRLARIAAGTPRATDAERFPDDDYIERDHDWVRKMLVAQPRRFHLERDVDETGVSGVGQVAVGVAFPPHHRSGRAALCWLTALASASFYRSIADVQAIHGHGGKTRVVFVDGQPAEEA